MTAREDRELEKKNKNLENEEDICIVSVTPGPSSHRVLHLDPAQLQIQHLSSSLLALEKKEGMKFKIKNHFVCFGLLTILSHKSYMGGSLGCYIWTQPNGYLPRISESPKEKKGKVGLMV